MKITCKITGFYDFCMEETDWSHCSYLILNQISQPSVRFELPKDHFLEMYPEEMDFWPEIGDIWEISFTRKNI